jgi:hypothetical protein
MALTAVIKTGERRVIEFFVSPFIKYVDESITPRGFQIALFKSISMPACLISFATRSLHPPLESMGMDTAPE